MTQIIDPIKLKAAAEHLEWVLRQYPNSDEAQSLFRAIAPLIHAAEAGDIASPLQRWDIPCAYNFADGMYRSYKEPNIEDAYVAFSIELRGELTEQEKQLHERIEQIQQTVRTEAGE